MSAPAEVRAPRMSPGTLAMLELLRILYPHKLSGFAYLDSVAEWKARAAIAAASEARHG